MMLLDACKNCPLLKGKEGKPPCYDDNGLYLGIWMVSPLACEEVIKKKLEAST